MQHDTAKPTAGPQLAGGFPGAAAVCLGLARCLLAMLTDGSRANITPFSTLKRSGQNKLPSVASASAPHPTATEPAHHLPLTTEPRRRAGSARSLPTYQGVSIIKHNLACGQASRISHVRIGMVDREGTQTWQRTNSR